MHENTQFSVIFALLLYCVQVISPHLNPFRKQSLYSLVKIYLYFKC